MSFALPTAFSLAALALPIIALYVLKVRLRRVPVSTNLFWKQIFEEKPPRSFWRDLRHLSSLLLQLLLLLLIVLAIADPVLDGTLKGARRWVLVIDNSASMRATDVEPTRLEAAKSAALEIIEGLRFQDQLAIVLAGRSPQVISGMTGNIPALRQALRDISFSDNPASLSEAIELGNRLLGQELSGKVIVFTDGCVEATGQQETAEVASAVAELKPAESANSTSSEEFSRQPADGNRGKGEFSSVEYRLFGTEAGNVGIIQLQARRSMADPLGYEILVSVRNASAAFVSCRLELALNDVAIDVIPLRLDPEQKWSRSIAMTSADGGVITAKLTQITPRVDATGDKSAKANDASDPQKATGEVNGLLLDDVARSLLPAREKQKVLIVSQGNLFLQKAFEASGLAEITVQKNFPEQWPADTVIVLHRQVPKTLPEGPVLIIDPAESCDQWELGDIVENPIVSQQNSESPLMTYLRFDNIQIPKSRVVRFHTAVNSLVSTLAGDILYAELPRSAGRCLVLSIDLDSSDFAFRTSFPGLVANALEWFSGESGDFLMSVAAGEMASLPIGSNRHVNNSASAMRAAAQSSEPIEAPEYVRPSLIADATNELSNQAILQAPDFARTPIVLRRSETDSTFSATIGPLNKTGLWKILPAAAASFSGSDSESQPELATVAVNLASERESDLRPLKALAAGEVFESDETNSINRPLWFSLAILACLLTTVEWILYHRRIIS